MRFAINGVCCILMVLATAYDLVFGLYEPAALCAVVAAFTGFTAYLEIVLLRK